MKYDFDRIIDRSGTDCVKWDHLDKSFPKAKKDALALWVADMDFACAKPIQDALHARIEKEIYGYTNANDEEYISVVQNWFMRRFDWKFHKEDMFYSPGIVPAIAYLISILSKPGQGIIIQEPVYYPFARNIRNHNRLIENNQLRCDNGEYSIDFEDLEERMKKDSTAGMILCSPHNPVGRIWHEQELNKIVDIAKTYGKWIISDEIHCDIVRKDAKHISLAKLRPDYQDQIIMCTAPSKSFNLAGIQNSNIIIHNEGYKKLWRQEIMNKLCIHAPNGFAQIATIASYRDSEDWLDQVNAYMDENIAYATQYLRAQLPKSVVSPCEGTYLLWVNMKAYCADANQLEDHMQKDAGVLLDEGYLFGESGKGYERINCACPRSILEEALQRIVTVFQNQ